MPSHLLEKVAVEKPLRLRIKVQPRNISQREYLDKIDSADMTFGLGPAGTGKSWMAVYKAVQYLIDKRVQKIILVRPAVEAGEKLGFLPGSLQEKLDPFMAPLFAALEDLLGADKRDKLIEAKVIEVAPIAFMRGRTLSDAFIILDEAQNTTFEQLTMFVTRFGPGSKVVITGDMSQVDLPKKGGSGLHKMVKKLFPVQGIAFHEFDSSDVVRHPLVGRIVQALETEE